MSTYCYFLRLACSKHPQTTALVVPAFKPPGEVNIKFTNMSVILRFRLVRVTYGDSGMTTEADVHWVIHGLSLAASCMRNCELRNMLSMRTLPQVVLVMSLLSSSHPPVADFVVSNPRMSTKTGFTRLSRGAQECHDDQVFRSCPAGVSDVPRLPCKERPGLSVSSYRSTSSYPQIFCHGFSSDQPWRCHHLPAVEGIHGLQGPTT